MNDVRMGQIAVLFIKCKLREEGIRLAPNFRQHVISTFGSFGMQLEEAPEFADTIIREILEEEGLRSRRRIIGFTAGK